MVQSVLIYLYAGAQLGAELQKLGDRILDSRISANAAILFDWDNWWVLEQSEKAYYCSQSRGTVCQRFIGELCNFFLHFYAGRV